MLYVGVLLFLVLQYLRPQEYVQIIYGWRVVLGTMLVLLPGWLATLQNKKLLRTPEDLFMGLYWCVCVLSVFKYRPAHVPDIAWEFGKVLLCYLFVAHIIDSRRRLGAAMFVMCLLLLGVAMQAGQGVGLPNQYASIGMFGNRNDFAHGIAAALPIAAAFLLGGGLFLKIVGLGLIVAIIPELIKSGSRGGQLAAMVAVYAILVVRAKKTRTRNLMVVLGLLGGLAVFAASERLATVVEYQTDPSAMGRVMFWSSCLRSFRATPLNLIMGRGYGTIIEGMLRSRAAHSSYMNNLFELGAPGLFILIGLLFFAVRDAYALAQNALRPATRMLALGLTGLMAGTIIGSAVETLSYRIYVLVPVAMISALRVIEQRERAAAALTGPDGDAGSTYCFLRPIATDGFRLVERRMVTGKDLRTVALLTFACWLSYTVLVAVS